MTDSPYMTPSDLVKRFKNAFTLVALKRWRWRRKHNREGLNLLVIDYLAAEEKPEDEARDH